MNDKQIRGALLLLILAIAILMMPLQVFGDNGQGASEAGDTAEFFVVPMKYQLPDNGSLQSTGSTTYIVNGAESEETEGNRLRFLMPKGVGPVTFSIRDLRLTGEEEGTINCDFRLTMKRQDAKDTSGMTVEISKEALPIIRIAGQTGVSLEYGWYEVGGVFHSLIRPLISEHYSPVAPDMEQPEEGKAGESRQSDTGSETIGNQSKAGGSEDVVKETSTTTKKEETKEKSEKTEKESVKTMEEAVEQNEEKKESNKDTKVKDGKPLQRTSVTDISQPMNHVRITEKVTSGKAKIDKDSIRVTHNGTDVTDNCIISMAEDGFVVDTQMNTNKGDRFVTTYKAVPEGGGEITSQTGTLAESAEEEEPEDDFEEIHMPDKTATQKPEVIRSTTHYTKAAYVLIVLLLTAAMALVSKIKKNMGGKLCIRKKLNLVS